MDHYNLNSLNFIHLIFDHINLYQNIKQLQQFHEHLIFDLTA